VFMLEMIWPLSGRTGVAVERYDTIEEFNLDGEAEWSA